MCTPCRQAFCITNRKTNYISFICNIHANLIFFSLTCYIFSLVSPSFASESPYLSQLRKAKQKSGSSLDRDKSLEKDNSKEQSPIHNRSFQLKRTQSAPEFNVPRDLAVTYNARMDRAALAMGVCPVCKVQLTEDHDYSPTRISDCKNMRHFSCPKCHSEYDIHR